MKFIVVLSFFFIMTQAACHKANLGHPQDTGSHVLSANLSVNLTATDESKLTLANKQCAPLSSGLCSVDIKWTTAKTVIIFVSTSDSPNTKNPFACSGASGQQNAPWIQPNIAYTFEMVEVSDCSASYSGNPVAKISFTTGSAVNTAPTMPLGGANMFLIFDQYMGLGSGSDLSPNYQQLTKAMAKKAIDDASYAGIKLVRLAGSGWGPVFYNSDPRLNSLWIWKNDPQRFWSTTDEMLNDFQAKGIQLVVELVVLAESFPAMLGNETVGDLIKNPNSVSYQQELQFISQYVQRYKNHPAVLMWEIHNEMNLSADIDTKGRCPDVWKQYIQNAADKVRLCGVSDNYTTAEMNAYNQRVADFIRSIDPVHKISSGNAIARPNAFHLRNQPDFSSAGANWTADNYAEFEANIRDVSAPFDVISMHIYNGDTTNADRPYLSTSDVRSAEILDFAKRASDAAGKPLYVGEYYDTSTPPAEMSGLPFTNNMLQKIEALGIPFHTVWNWEFYQNSTYDFPSFTSGPNDLEIGFEDQFIQNLRNYNIRQGNPVYQPASPDQTPPRALITWPIDQMSLDDPRVQQANFVYASASDDSLKQVRVRLYSNGRYVAESIKAPYKFSFSGIPLVVGWNQIKIKVYDSSLNSTEQNISVYSSQANAVATPNEPPVGPAPQFTVTSSDSSKINVVNGTCSYISPGLCGVDLTWNTSRQVVITVSTSLNPGARSIFSCGGSSTANAPWIVDNVTYTFEMFESDTCSNGALSGIPPVATMTLKNVP